MIHAMVIVFVLTVDICVGQPVIVEWEYEQVQIDCLDDCDGGPVLRFEWRLWQPRRTAWVNTGLAVDPSESYAFVIPNGSLTRGIHEIRIRACNALHCGMWLPMGYIVKRC